MCTSDNNAETAKGMTVLEMVIAMSILSVVFAAVVPVLTGIRNSWGARQANAEAVQNGRVVVDHMYRNLIKAVRIEQISARFRTDGYLEFESEDGHDYRYEVGDDGYVRFGRVGDLSDLAGPVNELRFTGYAAADLDAPTTDVDAIRFVRAETTLAALSALSRARTFTTCAYLRTRGQDQGIWNDRDIGDVHEDGSASHSGNDWTIEGGGEDIWQRHDEFHYVYRSLSGDGQIIAQVQSLDYTDAWAKSGVMLRETLDDDSKFAYMFMTAGRGCSFRSRAAGGGLAEHTQGSGYWFFFPVWLKLTRSGDTFSGYASLDGLHWSLVERVTIDMDEDVTIGLAVSACDRNDLCESEIGNVYVTSRVTAGAALVPETLYAPAIDGEIDAVWSGAPAQSFNQVVWGYRHWLYPDYDLSGTWKAMWDTSGIYYLVDITDDRLRASGGPNWREDDTVEVFIDADNSKQPAYDGENDFHYAFRWNDSTVHVGPESVDDDTGVRFATSATHDGYRVEIAVPFSTLGVEPAEAHVLGADMFLDDDDDNGGREATMAWYGGNDAYWQFPSQWGTAELTEHDFGTDDGQLLP